MLLCVSLVGPTKFENSLSFMQNIFDAWEFKENGLKILNFGKTGFKTYVFEKHFISYSCILFINLNSLRSFCTKLLWFFKILFFPEFQSIKPIFRSIKIAIKNFGQPLSVSIDTRLILDQSKHFRSIEPNFRSIENHIKSF